MLWPLADQPRLVAGAPGGTTPVRLTDDDLASSLSGGGRLDTLLSAVDFATSPAVDPGGQVRSATCLVVDPDLLVTVNAMTTGYAVNDTPDAGPNSPTHPGIGQDAAVAWLGRLKTLAQRMCVTSSVYAQADLTALEKVGDAGLATAATQAAPDVVDQILGIQSARGATIVGDGPDHRARVAAALRAGPDRRDRGSPVRAGRVDGRRPPPASTSTPRGTRHRSSSPRSTQRSARHWPARVALRRRRRTSTRRWTFRSDTIRPWHGDRTPWPPCCGAACAPATCHAPRS